MQKQRGFVGVGVLIAIVLGLIVVGGGAYYVVQQQASTQTASENFDNLQQLPTTNNQQTKTTTSAPTQTTPTNNQVQQPQVTSNTSADNKFEIHFDNLSRYIQDTKEKYGTYWYFDIQNGKIIYHEMGALRIADGPPQPRCILPIKNVDTAVVFAVVDNRYLIADNQLFWMCETVGPIDAANLRQLNGPRGGEVVLYDGKSVVIAGKVQPVLDSGTFASVDHKGPDTLGGTEYFKDSKAVYYGGGSKFVKLPNADPSTFSIFERGPVEFVPDEGNTTARYAKDKNHAYYNGTVLPTKNPGEFGVFGNGSFAIDESSIYVYGKPIMTGIRKQDIEVYYSNRDEFFQMGGTLDFLIKRIDTNKWYHYKWSEKTLSEIAAPASTKIEVRLFPQP